MKIIDALSKDIEALRTAALDEEAKERDVIRGFNKHVRIFFDYPVFKITDGRYCITDLKFLLENVCGGLLWRLRTDENLQQYRAGYGRLMEEYFKFLIKNIFSKSKFKFGEQAGADAIVEDGDTIFVFEFTVEGHRIYSLYDNSEEGFLEDAYRALFNKGKDDPRGRGKTDKGKIHKLHSYISQHQQKGKRVIPVLVTENILGDADLLNSFDYFYNKEIVDQNLYFTEPPLFLSLDDLETFWALHDPNDAVDGLQAFADEWSKADKGPRFHNASCGITNFVEKQRGEARICNHDYSDFFSNKNLYSA
jgi:hypothetical protein